MIISHDTMIEAIVDVLLPDANESRSRLLVKVLRTLTVDQIVHVISAANVAVKESKRSVIRDAVESRNMLMVAATSRWGTVVNVAALEAALNRQYGHGDTMYDVYSPTFDAHVEAYATYHSYCGKCTPSDRDIYYGAMEEMGIEPPILEAHYVDYLQDYELMDIVEKHPSSVSTFVRFAAERKGIDEGLLQELIAANGNALQDGIL